MYKTHSGDVACMSLCSSPPGSSLPSTCCNQGLAASVIAEHAEDQIQEELKDSKGSLSEHESEILFFFLIFSSFLQGLAVI